MRTLYVVPGYSAAGSMRQAIRAAGRDEEVMLCPDDLSWGPIDPGDPAARTAWWTRFYDMPEIESELETFWGRIATANDRLVLWFGRHSASELAFFLAMADRLGDRPYDIVDVTGVQLPFYRAVSIIPPDTLRALFGSERPATTQERAEAHGQWRQLRKENAPFRIVTPTGLASAPADYFDTLLIEQATTEWQRMARIVGGMMGATSEPYYQVGDLMLLTRVVALIDEGKLLADGDPWDMRSCRVRLPG